jgi:sugar/nucleoside kinase (ribokinase family)
MDKNIALVGLSFNSEEYYYYNGKAESEKVPITNHKEALGGTSANVAAAIRTLGKESKVLALTGPDDDEKTVLLEKVIKKQKLHYRKFPILNKSHYALILNDGLNPQQLLSFKGKIIEAEIDQTIAKIEEENGQWRIATGVRDQEVPLVEALFNKHEGFRSLNPRMELIQNKEAFKKLLKKTDLLILNYSEYHACNVASLTEFHECGPSLVIVTDSKNGGFFSHKKFKPETFNACKDYVNGSTQIYSVGCGDWFNGSLTSMCMDIGNSFPEMTCEELRISINFAARVAGKKVTMEGAINGPTPEDL